VKLAIVPPSAQDALTALATVMGARQFLSPAGWGDLGARKPVCGDVEMLGRARVRRDAAARRSGTNLKCRQA
jgi:hypothetical protein